MVKATSSSSVIEQIRRMARRALLPTGPDAWLYNRETLRWVVEDEVVFHGPKRLDWALRLLSLQFPFWGPVMGARWLLRLVAGTPLDADPDAYFVIDNMKVFVDPADSRFLQVPNELLRRTRVAAALETLVGPGDLFVDVGANYGSMSVLAARRVGGGGRILAMEPNPRVAVRLERTLEALSVPSRVHRAACGAKAGVGRIFIPLSSGAGSLVGGYADGGASEAIDCRIETLDAVLASESAGRRVVMKVDVEGYEIDALQGARETIRRLRPTIMVEINPSALKARGLSAEQVRTGLQSAGFWSFRPIQSSEPRPVASIDLTEHMDVVLEHDESCATGQQS